MQCVPRSSVYFLFTKTAWLLGDLAVMMLCEKWIQLLTGKPTHIAVVMLIYYLSIYVFSAILDRLPWLLRRPRLICSLLLPGVLLLLLLALTAIPVAPLLVYGLMVMIAGFSVLMTTCSSLVMDERVPAEQKPCLLSVQDVSSSLVGASAFWIGGYVLTDLQSVYTALLIGAGGYGASYVFLHLLTQQPVVNEQTELVEEELGQMRIGWIAPLLLFGFYLLCKLFYTGIDPIHTVYASSVLHTGQEITFRFVGSLYIGGIVAPLFAPQLLRRLNMYGVFLILCCTLVGYFAALTVELPLVVLFVLLAIVGGAAHLLWTAMMIHLHHHFSGDELARYLLWYQQGDALGPCCSFLLVILLTGPFQVDIRLTTLMLSVLMIVPVLTLLRLQRRHARQNPTRMEIQPNEQPDYFL